MAVSFTAPSLLLPHGQDRLWSRVRYPQARTVLLPDPDHGPVTRYPGYEVIDSDLLIQAERTPGTRIFRNAMPGVVSLTELMVLIDAGYGPHCTVEAPAAATTVGLAAEAAVTG